jgi:nucleoside-diphosphate-sugar epimerase
MQIVKNVLLTGFHGGFGNAVTPILESAGWTVELFDLVAGQNPLDEESVRKAAEGCDAVVHAGVIAMTPVEHQLSSWPPTCSARGTSCSLPRLNASLG